MTSCAKARNRPNWSAGMPRRRCRPRLILEFGLGCPRERVMVLCAAGSHGGVKMSPQGTWQGRGERRQRRGKWITEERLPSVASDRRECSLARQGKADLWRVDTQQPRIEETVGEVETVSPSWTACFGLLPSARKAWPTMNPFSSCGGRSARDSPFTPGVAAWWQVVWRMPCPGSISLSR